jgi:Transcriptional regulatory protein, C terminal
MEIRALGPLDARDGDRAVPLGGPRQRAVLALLLLRAGELVSSERLIDHLWGGQPPASAASTLHVYVSRLRKLLPMGTLVSEGRGYRLAVRELDIDARRFERLVDEGRRARTAGDASKRRRCCARRWGCGAGRRSPISPTNRSRRARSRGWRNCGWPRSRSASTPILHSGATLRWPLSWTG